MDYACECPKMFGYVIQEGIIDKFRLRSNILNTLITNYLSSDLTKRS